MVTTKIPSLLNYTRSIVPSEGAFWALRSGKREPIPVTTKTVLGTIAHYKGVYKGDKQKGEAEIKKAQEAGSNNIQQVDSCALPPGIDTFQLEFTLKLLPNSVSPEACNDSDFAQILSDITGEYKNKGGYKVLAEMYLSRICNGSFLWRNRYGIDRKLVLNAPFEQTLEKVELDIRDFQEPRLPGELKQQLSSWIDRIAAALSGEGDHLVIQVIAQVCAGEGQEIYPSQEFVERSTSKKSKTLFHVPVSANSTETTAGMHSQKIGNAIRTIDVWYPGASGVRPLAIEPFTVDKRRSETLRLPNKQKSDFYSLLKRAPEILEGVKSAASADDIPADVHYVVAVMIRGGVFSGEGEK